MQTVNEKLITELKSSPVKTINGEMVTLIDEDLRTALFELLSQPSEGVSESDEEAAWQHYWENNPDTIIAENSRPKEVIAYVAACRMIRQQLSQQQQLQQQIDDLQKWKESAMVIMKDIPAIGKAIGVPLGQSIHDKILPAIRQLQQRSYSEEDMYEAYKAENPLRISDGMKRQLFNKWLTKYNNK